MKKKCLIVVCALTCVLSLSAGVAAQSREEFRVIVPFDFVAAGKTMPAGTYTVSRVSQSGLSGLQLNNYERKATVVVLPTELVNTAGNADVRLGFAEVGDDRFLKQIVTDSGTYNLSIARSVAVMARMKRPSDASISGTQ